MIILKKKKQLFFEDSEYSTMLYIHEKKNEKNIYIVNLIEAPLLKVNVTSKVYCSGFRLQYACSLFYILTKILHTGTQH